LCIKVVKCIFFKFFLRHLMLCECLSSSGTCSPPISSVISMVENISFFSLSSNYMVASIVAPHSFLHRTLDYSRNINHCASESVYSP
jgi:hypothetical protein